jgi:hypothetical protein
MAAGPSRIHNFVQEHCLDCHEGETSKAGLDLSTMGLDLGKRSTLEAWVKVYDRVAAGEMPPGKGRTPPHVQTKQFLEALGDPLIATDLARESAAGRATRRRLNRFEYENTLRDLFDAPWLQVKDLLPEDGESHRFNKVGESLDVSFVQMAQYLMVAEQTIRQVLKAESRRAEFISTRYYAREMPSFLEPMKYGEFNNSSDRATFPTLGFSAQPEVRAGRMPMTVGAADLVNRELEGVGVVASAYEPIEPRFDKFHAPVSGRYKLTLRAHSIWTAANGVNGRGKRAWFQADIDTASKGRRSEPVTLYAKNHSGRLRRLGAFDIDPALTIREVEAYLEQGETIAPDANRLFRSRPPSWQNPLATQEGVPGVVFRSLDVQGPIIEAWPTKGQQLLFADLALKSTAKDVIEYISTSPAADAERLMSNFLSKAYRRQATKEDLDSFLAVIKRAQDAGASFTEAMIAGYVAVLCSPRFIYIEEAPGDLDSIALATRLSYFLWNSSPDDNLRAAAAKGELEKPATLAAQVDRMLNDPRSERFTNAFLNYWLDLRRMTANAPDAELYPDYYLDDLLQDSAAEETVAFFTELVRKNLPARNLVSSDFVMVNERLAEHYGIPGVKGVAIRRTKVPKGSPRGGILTQASVLKVTANGTTTSPVIRGVWIQERLLGQPSPPPPAGVPSVEPDIRGAKTIREQLDKHRADPKCASCHTKIDPPGFALESFDVFGAWRDNYRAVGDGTPVVGIGKAGHAYKFHLAKPADCTGVTSTGKAFKDITQFKKLLLSDERQLARNLAKQLVIYATGAPVRFGDRARLESILDRSVQTKLGVRTLITEVVKSELFRRK